MAQGIHVVEDVFYIGGNSRQAVNALVECSGVDFRFLFARSNIVPLSLGDGTIFERLTFLWPIPRPDDWAY